MSIIKIDKIVASGCSFTYGEELANPEKEAWPSLVAEKFNAQVCNLGMLGAGNEYITNSIIEYCSNNNVENTVFVVMYSHFSRQVFCRSEDVNLLRHIHIHSRSIQDQELKNLLFTRYYNEEYLFKRFLTQIILLQNFFKANNYPYIMCTSLAQAMPEEIPNSLQSMIDMIDKNRYKGFYTDSFDSLTSTAYRAAGGHPDARAHKQMAYLITKWIKDDFQV